ncbi:MAG TPA: hypothetical protein VII82_15630 [Polyangiaceae bacterium]
MKPSIPVAAFCLVASIGAGAGALAEPNPYQGSDTLLNVTRQSLTAVSLVAADYVGGGSANGQAAMALATPTQTTSPMTRLMNNGGGLCSFAGGTNGSGVTNASAIVIGLDAVDIIASLSTGASSACNGTGAGMGLLYSGGVLNSAGQTWKEVLALVYGGKDNRTGIVDCNQASRISLVVNWSNLFQNACANESTTCSDSDHSVGTGITAGTAPLWHAFRRDDTSGTTDVLATILGLSPSTSSSAVSGFGTSAYCNALNWDTTNNSKGTCQASVGGVLQAFNPHAQFTGPGGVVDTSDPNYPNCLTTANGGSPSTTSSKSCHRMPPPGINGLQVYGAVPATFKFKGANVAFDVLPTDMQDNDPIRRGCIGGTVKVAGHIGEDVCNIDGALGLVLPLVDTNFIANLPDPAHIGSNLRQYPPVAQKCSGAFINGAPPNIFSCAPSNNFHPGECPNGDAPSGGACLLPIASGFGQCNASNSTVTASFVRPAAGAADGRAYNLFMTNGTLSDGAVTFVQQNLPSLGTGIDFAGGFARIHQVDVAVAGATPCEMVAIDDQVGCLGQADPCSIGYAGDGAKGWNQHAETPGGPTLPAAAAVDAIAVNTVYPQVSTVQLLGKAGEYPLSRKIYFASLAGFSTVTSDELTLAKFESATAPGTPFDTILTSNGFFELGAQAGSVAGGAANTAFCEDLDEQVVCNPTPASASTLAANVNGCATNPAGIPTASTTCGNGTQEVYEECDHGTNNGATGDSCAQTCRCVGAFPCQ